jgi:hydroxyacylglutathione hydrolase
LSLKLVTRVVGPFATNCYIIHDSDSSEAAIIDPGGDPDVIRGIVDSSSLSVAIILLTHGHPDHTFYAGALADVYCAQIAMHPGDLAYAQEFMCVAEGFYDMSQYVPFEPSRILNDGDVIDIDGMTITAFHTPGHSASGMCFVVGDHVFCGDTLFAGSIGRTDFPGGSYSQLRRSIHDKLLVLPDDTTLCPGHGPQTTVGAERAHNPFL